MSPWWESEEAAASLVRLHIAQHGFNERIALPGLADRVIRCANRYARRFGGVRTVADWQRLALWIAGRAGFDHQSTLRKLIDTGYRPRSLISLEKLPRDEFYFPSPKRALYEIKERAASINAARIKRLRQERERFLNSCAVCGQPSTHPQSAFSGFSWRRDDAWLLEISGLMPLAQRYEWRVNRIPFCFAHGMQFRRILKQTERLQKLRISINRTKKELNREATENHA
jgi:hypothetical protein